MDSLTFTAYRQKERIKIINGLLFGQRQRMHIEIRTLDNSPLTQENALLKISATTLNLTTYERYKSRLLRGFADYAIDDIHDQSSKEPVGEKVCSTRYPDAPPCLFFRNSTDRCNCKERIADDDICPHEIILFGFDKNMFQPMHLCRKRVTGSLIGWTQSKKQMSVDDIIGYDGETLDEGTQSEDFLGQVK